jgi:hypothetical protein
MNILIGIVIGILALGGVYEYGHHVGYQERDAETIVQVEKINQENLKKTQTLEQEKNDVASQLEDLRNESKKQIAKLNSDLTANKLQFYVKVKPSSNCPSSTPSSPRTDQTDVAQLDSSVATALVNITAQGDEGITRLNACVAFYNQIRSMVNGSTNTQ